jgi:hypothetical protein
LFLNLVYSHITSYKFLQKLIFRILIGRDGLTVYWFHILGERNKLTDFENVILKTCIGTVQNKSMVCICGEAFAGM